MFGRSQSVRATNDLNLLLQLSRRCLTLHMHASRCRPKVCVCSASNSSMISPRHPPDTDTLFNGCTMVRVIARSLVSDDRVDTRCSKATARHSSTQSQTRKVCVWPCFVISKLMLGFLQAISSPDRSKYNSSTIPHAVPCCCDNSVVLLRLRPNMYTIPWVLYGVKTPQRSNTVSFELRKCIVCVDEDVHTRRSGCGHSILCCEYSSMHNFLCSHFVLVSCAKSVAAHRQRLCPWCRRVHFLYAVSEAYTPVDPANDLKAKQMNRQIKN